MDFDYAYYALTEGSKGKDQTAALSSPSREAYRKQLAETMNLNHTRILAFRNKPQAPGLGGSSSMPSEEPEAEAKVTDTVGVGFIEVDDEMLDGLPKTDPITSEEIMVAAVDNNQEGVQIAQLFNKMCKVLDENAGESVQAYANNQPSSGKLNENFGSLESINGNISRILSAPSDQLKSHEDTKPNLNNVEMKDSVEEAKPLRGSVDLNVLEGEENITSSVSTDGSRIAECVHWITASAPEGKYIGCLSRTYAAFS